MKIVYVSELLYPFAKGGAERRIYEIGRRLVERGHEVHWYGMAPGALVPADGMANGMHLHRIGEPGNLYAAEGRRAILPALRFTALLARSVLHDRSVLRSADILDCSLYPFFHCLLLRLLAPRRPLIVTWHEFWGSYWLEYLGPAGVIGQVVEWLTARTATHLVPNSETARQGLAGAGVRAGKMTVIESGVDTAAIAAVPPAERGSEVVYFGRLKNHKNVDVLLRAMALVRDERPSVRCLIIGSGPEEGALRRLSGALALEGCVEFAGSIDAFDDLIASVKAAKLFVHPSTKEGGGSITVLEANAAGVPVLAVRHPLGIDPGLIEHGVNGYWVDELSPGSIARAIVDHLAQPEKSEYRRASSEAAARAYDWRAVADACEALYQRLVACRQSVTAVTAPLLPATEDPRPGEVARP